MPEKYGSHSKPLHRKSGSCYDGNMRTNNGNGQYDGLLFTIGESASFNGFAGTTEFEAFPLRQLFLNKHHKFPCEWDTGYFLKEDLQSYINEHKKHVIVTHFLKNGIDFSRCVLYLGVSEHLYVYLYNRRNYYDVEHYSVCLLFTRKTKRIDKIIDSFIKLVIPEKEENEGFLNILVLGSNGYSLEQKKISCPEIDFKLNYNQDFEPIHNLICEKLSVENSKGLILLHGVPGTGKTTYIRYLINNLKKRVIYIPPNMTSALSDPALIKFFIEKSNSVLVIEDAENVLMKRAANSTQAIANILNLSDGLLSDCANIQIVATFNTDILNIDSALLRKGRLIAKYEFTPLEESRAKKLSNKLGVEINGEHTLSDIYNANEKSFNKKKGGIGFNP